jgi:energy-coupling factor transporter ATP-binding protein EcfA2
MISVENLFFSYRDYQKGGFYQPLYKKLTFKVPKGQKILVVGKPDSGKSTLSRILCSLIPRHIEGKIEGSIRLDNQEIIGIASYLLTEKITLITQNSQEQLLMTSCSDEIAFPLESLGLKQDEIKKRVESSLEMWGLTDLAQVNPQEISGGERKRLLLAVSSAIDAPIWIMDEPFDDLDNNYKNKLLEFIKESNKTIIVFASRYLTLYKDSFDAYWVLKDGQIESVDQKSLATNYDTIHKFNFERKEKEERKILECKEAKIIHPRRSEYSQNPFTLFVPTFKIEQGEVVALVGPNGAGKSTLSRSLCGLDSLVAGSIAVNGVEFTQKQLQTSVGYLFQNPDYSIFLPTVGSEIGWSLRNNKEMTKKEKEQLVLECANLFNLQVDDNPTMMSYGSRKRLQAAVAYMLNRPFLIIDELDSALTYEDSYKIVELLRSNNSAIVIITHDYNFANILAKRIYTIDDGNVVEKEGLL